MRSIWFLTISLTLHVAALGYFIAIDDRQPLPPIAVTILPMEPDIKAETAAGGNGSGGAQSKQPAKKIVVKRAGQTEQRVADIDKTNEALTHPSVIEVSANASEASIVNALSSVGAEVAAASTGAGSAAGGGSGSSGGGSAAGVGRGSAPRAVITAPARYSDTPRPAYPESARREGREGRVLLRVLIDDQGETKAVEVSRSSGSDALDHAASSAIKRWRFHPARSGDQPIESWVNVPIDFRLSETKN